MKIGRKLIAFLTVFLTILGNGFTAFAPVAHASPTWYERKVIVNKTVNGGETDVQPSDVQFSFKIQKGTYHWIGDYYTWEDKNILGTYTVSVASDYIKDGLEHGYYRIWEVTPLTSQAQAAGYSYGSISGGDSVDGNYAYFFFDAWCSETYNITINNNRSYGSITVNKIVTGGTANAGDVFTFELYKGSTKIDTKTITSPATSCTFSGLVYGNYAIKELNAFGYQRPSSFITGAAVTVDSASESIDCTNTKLKGSITVTKNVTGGSANVGDVFTFELYKGTSKIDTRTITAPATTCTFSDLEYGNYTIKELDAFGYGRPASFVSGAAVTVDSASESITCSNEKLYGSIQITKSVGSEAVRNGDVFTFKLYKGTDTTATPVKTKTLTHVDTFPCTFTFDGLEYGDYTLIEEKAGSFNGTPVFGGNINGSGVITVGGTQQNVTCANSRLYGSIRITKSVGNETVRSGDVFTFKLYKGTDTTAAPVKTKTLTHTDTFPCVFTFDGLEYGDYTLIEEKTGSFNGDPVFGGDISGSGVVNVNSELETVTCTNSRLHGSIVITKSVAGGADAGVTFPIVVKDASGAVVDTFDYAAGAPHTVSGLEFGTYTVTEGDVPTGYRFIGFDGTPSATKSTTVTVNSTTVPATVTVNNEKLATIIFVKKDNLGQPVEGVSFEYQLKTGAEWPAEWIETGKTGVTGTVTVANLIPGDYRVRECDYPAGYVKDTNVYTYTLPAGEEKSFEFENDGLCDLTIEKVDSRDTSKRLQGAKFTIVNSDEGITVTREDDSDGVVDGYIHFNDLLIGDWTLTEIVAPDGYHLDSTPADYSLAVGDRTIQVPNDLDVGDLKVRKINTYTGDGVENVTIEASTKKNFSSDVYTATTGADGYALFSDLPVGTYYIREDTPNSFKPNNTKLQATVTFKTTTVKDIEGNDLVFENIPRQKVRIFKYDASDDSIKLEGAEFEIYSDAACTVKVGDTLVTDADGKAVSGWLLYETPGTVYYVKETKAPGGGKYLADTTVKRVEYSAPGKVIKLAVENERNFGSLTISKELLGTNPAEPFEFTLTGPSYPDGHTFTLAGGESWTIPDLIFGDYTIKETAKDGYKLEGFYLNGHPLVYSEATGDYSFNFNVEYAGCTLMAANKELGSIDITKKLTGGIVRDQDFTFTITGPSFPEGQKFTLNPSNIGNADPDKAPESKLFGNLEYGLYTITEDEGDNFKLDGYKVGAGTSSGNTYSVWIGLAAGQNPTLTVTDEIVSEYNTLHDTVVAENLLLGKLTITKTDAANPLKYLDAEFTITSALLTAPLVVNTGDDGVYESDWLVPGEYAISETAPPAGYHNDNPGPTTYTLNSGETLGVKFTDQLDVGSLLVQKYSSYKTGDAPTPVAGVTFELLTKNAGTGSYTVVDTKVTGAGGQVEFTNLPTGGVYYVRESQQAPGYDIDKNLVNGPYTIKFAEQVKAADFVNNPVGQIRLWKYDASTVSGGNYTDATKLAGAVFGVYANAEATGTPLATVTSSATDGVLTAELPFGGNNPASYYVKEITAPEGYLLNTEIVKVTFATPGEIVDVRVSNVKNVGSYVVKKVDALDNTKTLAGAQFALFSDEAGTAQVSATVTTGADGIARFDNMAPGAYYLKELVAPTDYDLLTDTIPVTIQAGVTEQVTLTNQYNPPEDIATGMMDYNVLLLGGLALLCGVLLVVFTRKRRMANR